MRRKFQDQDKDKRNGRKNLLNTQDKWRRRKMDKNKKTNRQTDKWANVQVNK